MKVRADEEICVGDETCVEVCPEIFEMQEDVAVTKIKDVPEELEGAARKLRNHALWMPCSSKDRTKCHRLTSVSLDRR